jgi:hypothetical protein
MLKTTKCITIVLLLSTLLKAEEWKPFNKPNHYGNTVYYKYTSKDYNIRKDIDYFELREFLFEDKKQLSKNYIPMHIIAKKPLSSYSRSIISQFQRQPYIDDNVSNIKTELYEDNYFHRSRFYFKINGYLIKNDNSIWTVNEKKDLLWVFDGIDTEAELATFLWVYDSYEITCKYSYKKTATGYKVQKIESDYPHYDKELKKSFVNEKVFILDIRKDGMYSINLIEERRKYWGHRILEPNPMLGIGSETKESILNSDSFITPMKEFYLF